MSVWTSSCLANGSRRGCCLIGGCSPVSIRKHPINFLGCPKNPLNRPPPPSKVNAWEERIKKRKELQEAARQKALLANQAPTQTKNPSAQTTSPPTQIRSLTSTNKARPTPAPSMPTSKSSNEILNTLNELKDQEVKEMFEVLSHFVKIYKSNKSREEKFSELSNLLNLTF
ncbi:hypothetical protein TNCT_11781 [Trichonephila clavata]|uniref:Uncharacterized protein n=1 Tax=Trichonephila clavata TaxID=2740835 RepID=A0A8X6H6X6_TRICU|nr:hypothetical protein TNCT_11781 [Trichonephila clavata]